MADAGGIQLLPDTKKKIQLQSTGQNRVLIFSFVFVVLVGGLYGGLWWYQDSTQKKLEDINKQLSDIEATRNKKDEEKLLNLKDSLALVEPLIKSHVFWSDAFDRIQNLINPGVQFSSLGVSLGKSEYTFKAVARNYSTVAKQIAAFYKDDAITDVSLGKISTLSTGQIEFSTTLILNVDKLVKKNLGK